MKDDYPTDEELKQIKEYNVIANTLGFLDLLEEVWNTHYGKFELTGKKVKILKLITGGWSGNEDILDVIPKIFFTMFWQKSVRGGLYIFKIKTINGKR